MDNTVDHITHILMDMWTTQLTHIPTVQQICKYLVDMMDNRLTHIPTRYEYVDNEVDTHIHRYITTV